jgi:hypothetical protein
MWVQTVYLRAVKRPEARRVYHARILRDLLSLENRCVKHAFAHSRTTVSAKASAKTHSSTEASTEASTKASDRLAAASSTSSSGEANSEAHNEVIHIEVA